MLALCLFMRTGNIHVCVGPTTAPCGSPCRAAGQLQEISGTFLGMNMQQYMHMPRACMRHQAWGIARPGSARPTSHCSSTW
jgi:hypothetical protein